MVVPRPRLQTQSAIDLQFRTTGNCDELEKGSEERKSLGNDGLSIMKDRSAESTGEDRSPVTTSSETPFLFISDEVRLERTRC